MQERISAVNLISDDNELRALVFINAVGNTINSIGCTNLSNYKVTKTICLQPNEKIVGVRGKFRDSSYVGIFQFQLMLATLTIESPDAKKSIRPSLI